MQTADWLNPLIAGLHALQWHGLQALAALGLVDAVGGQPAWPFDGRLSGENLLIDGGQARRLAATVAVLAVALLLAAASVVWRRRRWLLAVAAIALPVLAPWPDRAVIVVPATPASFHRSPTDFAAASIVAGQPIYAARCSGCHGDTGRGDGPQARAQAVWPPDFVGPLLWRRADGDLFWHIREGLVDRDGRKTMPGFGEALSDTEIWQLIDYLKAQSAGEALRRAGEWIQPVRLPATTIDCAPASGRSDRAPWRGQRLRVYAAGEGEPPPIEDPRLVTIALGADPGADCAIREPAADAALRLITGGTPLAGKQWLVDRDGWLRAVAAPGGAPWSVDDLVCRSARAAAADAPASRPVGAGDGGASLPRRESDGLGALLSAIDADPVRYVKGGLPH